MILQRRVRRPKHRAGVWPASNSTARGCLLTAVAGLIALVSPACHQRNSDVSDRAAEPPPRVIVVAPVINLSGNAEIDTLRFTDILASEFLSFPGLSVVPVNMTLAALARAGKAYVETGDEAIELAREFSADATIVVGITEYDPYDPPVIGMVMQWYAPAELSESAGFDAVAASRRSSPLMRVADQVAATDGPLIQVQRVYNGSLDWVQDEVRRYAASRDGAQSPFSWRKHLKSQELFGRYSCWSLIRTILEQEKLYRFAQQVDETER